MKNTKLISLLKTFSKEEIKRFRDFVVSPYFNKNKNIQKLNDVLFRFHPNYDTQLPQEEEIFKEVFPGEKFDYFKFRNVSSDLYNLGLNFLRLTPNHNTEFTSEYNLIIQLRQRKLFNLHGKLVKSLEKQFKEKKIKDNVFLYSNYLVATESQFVDLFEKPSSISGILNEFESYFEYSINNLLFYYNLLIHIGKENNVQPEVKMMKEVTAFLSEGPVSSHPVALSYQYLILLKTRNKEDYFFRLKEHYFNNFAYMDDFSAYTVHMYMFGYCADKYNIAGDRRFIKEGYELYRHSYVNNRVTSGELLYPDFVNFIKVFVRAGDLELAQNFIKDYRDKLPADQIDNCLNFSYAYISHFGGDLENALKHISKVNFPLAILKVQVKIMEIQLNYQLSYFEETRNLVESFKRTLAKEVIVSEDYKSSITGFLKNTITLINLKQETNTKKRKLDSQMLAESVNSTQPNHFGIRFWLEDRLKEI